jgi:hypothetical protein
MLTKSITKVMLAGLLAAATLSPALAKMEKMPNACAMPRLRCTITSSCDANGWCKVYGCISNQTVLLPFYCNEKMGGCAQQHC